MLKLLGQIASIIYVSYDVTSNESINDTILLHNWIDNLR